MTAPDPLTRLLGRVEAIIERIEAALPAAPAPIDWKATAFRWRKRGGRGHLQAVAHPHAISIRPASRSGWTTCWSWKKAGARRRTARRTGSG